ncbi:anaerobic ribonucleoside-triphosphate reductase activating protein [Candidatus Micrarchaeota archaeon]|nr:anaerobic ribonucleoside-triphosphate reductase activating protein [Candidatus Micrarchaeota archaeon]MBD3417866.1 anaerobic ribonucleoside-triphosphate reductase activating protein [Candidatus Micrarchaeota archaeon]
MSLDFAYIEKTSLLDFPGEIASTLFTVGCNFRCPFCYNRSLVLPEEFPPQRVSAEQAVSELSKRKNFVGAAVITGGEPTIHPDLPWFLSSLKNEGFKVKLDTNGTNPEMLKELYSKELLDYVAMDIKSSLEHYDEAAGVSLDVSDIKESTRIIRSSGLPYEFRTTVAPGIHNLDRIEAIGKWLEGAEYYVLQPFAPQPSTIDKAFATKKPFDGKALNAMVSAAKPYFKKVELREYY